ncbi:MAG TPA: TetR/AcrR family transcriptional regulator [Acidimicrobiales bacterium]|nr:TetR/AcrR family transcriptional regulator [Acidimicrobiales bacterium]
MAGGRPLDHQRDTALRRAALELVGEIGYDRMTIEAVAARARAGKATVYRRWPSKAELVIDAFVNEAMGPAVPDTGSLRGDVIALATRLWEDSGPIPRTRVMVGLVSAMLTHPELREAMASISRPPKVVLEEILRRAVERGELPEMVGLDLPGTIVPAMCMFRVVTTGEPPTSEFIENVVDQVLMPALTAGATGPRRRRVSSSPKGD